MQRERITALVSPRWGSKAGALFNGSGQYKPIGENSIEVRGKWLDFRCHDLWTFMVLEMFMNQRMLRLCEHPGCVQQLYFIAQHGKERYCSTDCSNWSQSQLKKRWHAEQRLKRSLAAGARIGKKGDHNGPRKAR
jgi:hypothetical protein